MPRGDKEPGAEGSAPLGHRAPSLISPDGTGRSAEGMNLVHWCLSDGVDPGAGGRAGSGEGCFSDRYHTLRHFVFQVLEQDILNRVLDKEDSPEHKGQLLCVFAWACRRAQGLRGFSIPRGVSHPQKAEHLKFLKRAFALLLQI